MQTPELLSDPAYQNENAARLYIESVRWPQGPYCPKCGAIDRVRELGGESMGPGWYYCEACQDKFTVRVGSVFERSHIPLHKWLLAIRLMTSSKKGVSAHQIHRTLAISYKSAWFLCHRILEAMSDDAGLPLGGEGKIIEADETFIGHTGDPGWIFVNGVGWVTTRQNDKMKVMTLVERGGRARSVKIDEVTADHVKAVLDVHASRKSVLMTDEGTWYRQPGRSFADHQTVVHRRKEYTRGKAGTNTVEGYFSIFKRGMKGVYQHCAEKHLHRYLAEFDFRYSNRIRLGVDDVERTRRAIAGAGGKRLTYRRTRGQQEGATPTA